MIWPPRKVAKQDFAGRRRSKANFAKNGAPAKVCHSEAKAKFCGESEEQQNELCGDFLQKNRLPQGPRERLRSKISWGEGGAREHADDFFEQKKSEQSELCSDVVHSQGLEPWAR